jgi:hypothetical protein
LDDKADKKQKEKALLKGLTKQSQKENALLKGLTKLTNSKGKCLA